MSAYAKALGKRAKTNPIDAQVIALFAAATKPQVRPLPDAATQALAADCGRAGLAGLARSREDRGSYFAHLSTVFDYVRQAMPFGDAQSLTDDELYAVVAYMLFLNAIVDEKFALLRETFGSVQMPNAGGFYDDDRETAERAFRNVPCMMNCKADAKIIGRARVIDVTPDDKRRPAAD